MKQTRLYSLFEKQPDGTWKRISELAYTKDSAVKIFQGALLHPFFNGGPVRELKVVKQ